MNIENNYQINDYFELYILCNQPIIQLLFSYYHRIFHAKIIKITAWDGNTNQDAVLKRITSNSKQ